MRVLLTGGAGYLGSVLAPLLHRSGHLVRVVDLLWFGCHLPEGIEVIQADLMEDSPSWYEGVDAVIHLAGLSNDPMSETDPTSAWRNNVGATSRVVSRCLEMGVQRMILASTCSVYGKCSDDLVTEDTPTRLVGVYAKTKGAAEAVVLTAANAHFRPTVFRMGTLHGWSPRLRVDLVVNAMTRAGLCSNTITVHDPLPWRPLLHVADAAQAFKDALERPEPLDGIVNLAQSNFRILEVGQQVQQALAARGHRTELSVQRRREVRSYRVSAQRALDSLALSAMRTIEDTVGEFWDLLPTDFDWHHPRLQNLSVAQQVRLCRTSK